MTLNYIKYFIKAFLAHALFSFLAFVIFKYLLMKVFVLTLCEIAVLLIGIVFSAYYSTLLKITNEDKIACYFKMFIYEQAFIDTMKKLELQELDIDIDNLPHLENWLRKEYGLDEDQIETIKTCYTGTSSEEKNNKRFLKLSVKEENL